MKKITDEKKYLIFAGVITGVISVLLVKLGNPRNMGFCIACFIRDTAGAMHLHNAAVVQYVRPEIIGIVLGSFVISLASGEFKPRGGSSVFLRFAIAFIVMIGALTFLGCPFRMILRLAGGDLNALIALMGFVAGIATSCYFINRGFDMGRSYKQKNIEGAAFPAVILFILVLFVCVPGIFAFSEKGPGSMHAKIYISLIAGIAVAALAQRSRLCMVGGIRDIILIKDTTLVIGFAAIFVSALLMNIITGNFKLGFNDQPVAHTAHLWNFLGMYIVGFGSALLGGCPLRQLVLAGEGNTDSAVSVLGMFTGAAFAHNFKLVGNATVNGPNNYGKAAVCICIAVLFIISCTITFAKKKD